MSWKNRPPIDGVALRRDLFFDGNPPEARKEQGSTADMLRKSDQDDSVGYRKPPSYTRFVKGQSGNPAGRPRRPIHFDRIEDQPTLLAILKEADQPITVRDGDRRMTLTKRQALEMAIMAGALKGNAPIMRLATEQLEKAEVLHAARVEYDHMIWNAYIAQCAEQDRDAVANGEPALRHIPHPEDIILEHGKLMRFRVLPTEETYERIESLVPLRDMLLMQDALDERIYRKQGHPEKAGGALLVALFINKSLLPPRMKINENAILRRQMRHQTMPQRQLLKAVHKGWRKIGGKPTRGMPFPSRTELQQFLETMIDTGLQAISQAKNEHGLA